MNKEVEKNILTKEGLAELKAELKNLVEIERPKVIADIKEARAKGDLSENAEFDAAREKQGQIEDRIRVINGLIENSSIIRTVTTSSKVRVGSTITVEETSNGDKVTYTIVGSLETNPFENKISNVSPLAVAVLGKEVGASVVVQAPNNKYEVKITKIKN